MPENQSYVCEKWLVDDNVRITDVILFHMKYDNFVRISCQFRSGQKGVFITSRFILNIALSSYCKGKHLSCLSYLLKYLSERDPR